MSLNLFSASCKFALFFKTETKKKEESSSDYSSKSPSPASSGRDEKTVENGFGEKLQLVLLF